MVNSINSEESFLIWRVQFPNRLVPSDVNFGKEPVVSDIDTVGFLFHHKYKQTWEPYKRGDFRIAKKLYSIIPNKIYINKVLTKLQRNDGGGAGKQDDLKDTKKSEEIAEIFNLQRDRSDTEIKKTLENTKKQINYDKVNQIFNGQRHVSIVSKKPENTSHNPKTNAEFLSKIASKNKKRNR